MGREGGPHKLTHKGMYHVTLWDVPPKKIWGGHPVVGKVTKGIFEEPRVMLDPNDSGHMAVCLGKPISKWAGESLNLNLRERGSDGRFWKRVASSCACFKKDHSLHSGGRTGGGQTSYKAGCWGPLGEHGWSSCWGCVKIQLESLTDWL